MFMCNIKYRWRIMKEKINIWIAWRLPRYLVMWCAVRVMSHAIAGEYGAESTTDLLAMDALKRWEKV